MEAELSERAHVDVVVGAVAHRQGAYVLEKFLANQNEIQGIYPGSRLVFATREPDFIPVLRSGLDRWGINGEVLYYETIKPAYARSRVWNIACGREALRKYAVQDVSVEHLLFVDLDMTYDPNLIGIMKRQIAGCDVVFSGCARRQFGLALAGGGCCMLEAGILKIIRFRCLEFQNGTAIYEDALLELDLMRLGARVKKGFFLTINHYLDNFTFKTVNAQPVGLYRRITHSGFVRRALISSSIFLRCDVGEELNSFVHRIFRIGDVLTIQSGLADEPTRDFPWAAGNNGRDDNGLSSRI